MEILYIWSILVGIGFYVYSLISFEKGEMPIFSTVTVILFMFFYYALGGIGMFEHDSIKVKNPNISIRASINNNIYSSYSVTETDSTITIHLYAKQDSINYLKE